ncbi:MAG: D-tyrosyl-tRNA(Tyr) deacylase, partial [Bacteroidetes bacterium]
MRALIQRVSRASVSVNNEIVGAIDQGLMVLLGIAHDDSINDIDWLVGKITNMRIFSDEEGKMNLSVQDVEGQILVVSQFTLHASTKKGNRPSFIEAARPELAIPLYEKFKTELGKIVPIASGEFGADMKVSLIN